MSKLTKQVTLLAPPSPEPQRKMELVRSQGMEENEPMHVVAVLMENQISNLVFQSLQTACEALNCSLQRIPFSQFDYGAADVLEAFYSADVVVTDLTERKIQQPLFYQMGVRESLGRSECVVTIMNQDPEIAQQLRFISSYKIVPYKVVDGSCFVVNLETDIDVVEKETDAPLSSTLGAILHEMEVRTLTQRKRWFMEQLRKKTELKDQKIRRQELKKLERTLTQDVSCITAEIILNLALAYRDIQEYDSIISLVSSLSNHPDVALSEPTPGEDEESGRKKRLAKVAIKVQHANALNRRNKEGDREKALNILLKEVVNNPKHCVPDNVCLVGRVYKDIFVESDYQRRDALQEAIKWYRKGFKIQQSEFAGINLATLLVISGENFHSNNELAQIGMCMNNSLGRKGNLETLTDYWTVATVFEMSILTEDFGQALKAASCMFKLHPPTWHLKSTMNNIKLILKNRPCRSRNPTVDVFNFWMELFHDVGNEESKPNDMPVLLLEPLDNQSPAVYQPCRLQVNREAQEIQLYNVTCDAREKLTSVGSLLPDIAVEWRFPATSIRRISLHNEDNTCLYLYAETSDFQMFFANEAQRAILYDVVHSFDPVRSSSLKHSSSVDRPISFEYERDEKGQKVKLGRGTFGVVYSARDQETLQLIAVKEVEIKNRTDLQQLQDEIQYHKRWNDQHIVRYLGSEVCEESHVFRIFMEQVPGGSLSDLLRRKWGPLEHNDELMADYTKQILKGLKHLHDFSVVHRDIKGDNVLVNQFDGTLKLSDFGTSKRLQRINPRTESTAGTFQFMAPEVINSQRGYGLPADIWSLGCTVVEMATGQIPFHNYNAAAAAIMFKVGRDRIHPDIPDSLTKEAKAFLARCFKPEPQARATADELLKDTWITRKHLRHRHKHATRSSVTNSPSTAGEKALTLPQKASRRSPSPASRKELKHQPHSHQSEHKSHNHMQHQQLSVSKNKNHRQHSHQQQGNSSPKAERPLTRAISAPSPSRTPPTKHRDRSSYAQKAAKTQNANSPASTPSSRPNSTETQPPFTQEGFNWDVPRQLSHTSSSGSGPPPSPSASSTASVSKTPAPSEADLRQQRAIEHQETLKTLVKILKSQSKPIVSHWLQQAQKSPSVGSASFLRQHSSGEHLELQTLASLHAELTILITADNEKGNQPTAGLEELIYNTESESYFHLQQALTFYKEVILSTLKEHHKTIKPHWMFDIDKRIDRAVKVVRNELAKTHDDVSATQLTAQAKRAMMRRSVSDPDPQDLNRGMIRFSSESTGVTIKRAQTDMQAVPEGKRFHLDKPLNPNAANFTAQDVPRRAPNLADMHHVSMDSSEGEYPQMSAELARLENENRILLGKLLSVNQELNKRLLHSLEEKRMQSAVLDPQHVKVHDSPRSPLAASSFSSDTTAALVNNADSQMVTFLQELHFSETDIAPFAEQEFTYETLVKWVSKEDLVSLVSKAGPRCRLWARILELR
eukprot:m.145857 g.145857  ORF g.145857 m.145857 type:complete len:1473 (+) comp24287_c0_seq1:102-4520(+)